MIDSSNLLSSDFQSNQNSQNDIRIRKIQQNLIMMGFDLEMINKIISYFKIRTEDEALDYLIKTEDGMWNHPFIPKVINPEDLNNGFLEQPKVMMNNVITRINSFKLTNNANLRSSITMPNTDSNQDEIIIQDNICEICGESKEFHKIKEYIAPNNNINNNIINNNENNNILNEEENNSLLNGNDIKINIKNDTNINNNKDIQKEDEEENLNPKECQICMGDLENPVEMEKCKHKFCEECFNSYLVNLINHNKIDQIPCPKNKCSNKELSEEFFSHFLSEQEYFKFRQFKSQNEIARDSKKIFCPLCDSYASIDGITEKYDSNSPNYKKSTLKCQNGHEFCSCGRPLHENDCYHDDKEFKDYLAEEKIKKCPKCGFLIKKNKGCNHMTCGNPICRYEFCWLCMKEAVPNHFEYGPCAGKQFFDPDSLEYRFQMSHPYLYCIYYIFKCIFSLIFFIVAFFVTPGIGLSLFAYEIIVENDSFRLSFKKKYMKYIMFMGFFCVSFCVQSIIYMIWGLIFGSLAAIIGIIIFIFVLYLLKTILKCIFCGCFYSNKKNNNFDVDLNIKSEELEPGIYVNGLEDNRPKDNGLKDNGLKGNRLKDNNKNRNNKINL